MFSPFSLSLCCICAISIRHFLKKKHGNVALSRIPGPECKSWLKGNMLELFNRQQGPQYHLELVEKYDRVARVNGFFGDQQLYISDPLALTTILNRDQEIFEETEVFISNNKIIFGEGLVATVGEQHKRQRRLITPVFSVHRLRRLVPIFYDVAYRVRDALKMQIIHSEASSPGEGDYVKVPSSDGSTRSSLRTVVDIAEWMSRAALESIATAGLGHSLDPLSSTAANAYTKAVKDLIPTLFSISLLRLLTPFVIRLGSPGFRRFMLNFVPIKAVHKVKAMADVMEVTCRGILNRKREARKNTVAEKTGNADEDIEANDVISVLLRASDAGGIGEKMTDAELIGQMNVLIFGAQDTTSSALSRIINLLSMHPEVQERLREEVRHAGEENNGHQLDYEGLLALPQLDMVIKETLRLYPPVPFIRRAARKRTSLTLSRPIRLLDGTYTDTIVVPRGTTVWLSITGVNRSKDVWGPDAAQWRPERWTSEGSNNPVGDEMDGTGSADDERWVNNAKSKLPGVYPGMLTFLSGGRSCVGYRFALIEMKAILTTLLQTFTFRPTGDRIVWNLSQILSPSVRCEDEDDGAKDKHGLPVEIGLIDGVEGYDDLALQ